MLSSPWVAWIRKQYATIVPILVTFVFCAYGMGSQQLADDETCSWWAIHLSFADLFHLLEHLDAVLAPYYLFLRGWVSIFGDSEVSLRMPSVIAMAVAAGIIARIGTRLGDSDTGLFAGLFFALMPTVTNYAHETRPYAITLAATAGSFLLLLRAMEAPGCWRNWIAYAAGIACVGLSHLVSLICLSAHAVAIFLTPHKPWVAFRPRLFLPWCVAVVVGLLPVVPLIWLGSTQQSSQIRATDPYKILINLPEALPMPVGLGWLLAFLAVVALLRQRSHVVMLLTWAVLPPVLLYMSYDSLCLFRARYILFTLPAWILLAALATTQLPLPKSFSKAAPLIFLGAIVMFGWNSQMAMRHTEPRELPFRLAGQVLCENAKPNDAIAFGGTSGGGQYHLRLAVAYAMRHQTPLRDVFVQEGAVVCGNFKAIECRYASQCSLDDVNRVWLLMKNKGFNQAGLPRFKIWLLSSQFVVRRTWPLDDYMLVLFERRSDNEPDVEQPIDARPSNPYGDEPSTDDDEY